MKSKECKEVKGPEVIGNIGNLTNLLNRGMCIGQDNMSNCVMKPSNNLNYLIGEDKDADLSTENVLHKISYLT